MTALMRELQKTIPVEDPCAYFIEKRILNSIIKREDKCISFYNDSPLIKNIDKNYWIKATNYYYLPTHLTQYSLIPLVWYEFTGKHMQMVN
jgi:hypothetical protein